jgi:hypothetical protein
MKKRTIVLFFLLGSAAARADGFRFVVPQGWVDLSPTAPAKNFERLAPEMASQLRAQKLAFFAADLDHATELMTNVSGTLLPGSGRITMATLDDAERHVAAEIAKQPGFAYHVMSRELVDWNGASVARFVAELDNHGHRVKQLGFMIPGATQTAMLTYATNEAEFDHYRPIFEAAARGTAGVAASPSRSSELLGVAIRAGILMVAVFAVLLVVRRLRARAR